MFTLDNPGQSLDEVTDYLNREHQPNYLYRGQVCDYYKMLPSVYRTAALSQLYDFSICAPKNDANRLEILKATLIFSLIQTFGSLVGNFLGQQYISLSGCIDITESPEVAAFFAKMKSPDYTEMCTENEEIGIIFRFDKRNFGNLKPKGVKSDFLKQSVDKFEVFNNLDSTSAFDTEDYSLGLDFDINNSLKHYTTKVNLNAYSDMKDYLEEIDRQLTSHFDENDSPSNFFARPKAQLGGAIQPRYLCQYHKDNLKNKYLQDAVGVEDLYDKYLMEKFYFRHTKVHLKYSREDIWPSPTKDPFLAILGLHVANLKKSGKIEPEIRIHQLLDCGFKDNIPEEFVNF